MARARGGVLTVAVTGAGGFVGGYLAADLEVAGHRVVRLARRPVAGHPDAVLWDLRRDREPGAPALPRVDAVVHCAASIATVDADGTMAEANVGGTRRILAAWPGVPVVHVSSAAVYPASNVGAGRGPWKEDDAGPDAPFGPYATTKRAAERAVEADAAATGRPATILRASIVFGPGDPLVLPNIRRMRVGRLVFCPGGRHAWTVTPVESIAAATRAALARPAAGARAVNVGEDPPRTIRALFVRLLEEDSGKRLRLVPLPAWPVIIAASIAEVGARVFTPGRAPILTRAAVAYLREERVLNLAAQRTLLAGAVSKM